MVTPEVVRAIAELEAEFGDRVSYVEDGSGGAYVTIVDVALLSPPYNSPTWIKFQIPHTYPYSHIYPLYVRHDLRIDGQLKTAMSSVNDYRGSKATQLSRKTDRHPLNPGFDTAAAKMRKVLDWLCEVA